MTTIAWDGKILAVDSRSSTPEQRPYEEQGEPMRRICFHCERPAWTGSDNADKLVVAPKSEWKGERILAAATAGSSDDCGRIRTLLRGRTELSLEKAWQGYAALQAPARTRMDRKFQATVVLVTEKRLWVLDFSGIELRSYQEPRDVPFARGSGRDAAMLAMQVLGRTAVDAVWAARSIDPATGGPVRWFDTTAFSPEEPDKRYRAQEEKPMSREQALTYVQNGFKHTEATDEPGKTVEVNAEPTESNGSKPADTVPPVAESRPAAKKVAKKKSRTTKQ